MSAIGENIRKYREESGMSQQQLADRIGKTRSAVSQYESGRTIPRMGVIQAIADTFNVNKSDIIGEHITYAVVTIRNEETELVKLFRAMDQDAKDALLATARALAK